MALSIFGELVVSAFVDIVVNGLFYLTGKLLLCLFGERRWQAASLDARQDRRVTPSRLSCHATDGRRIVGVETQIMLGLLFYVLLLAALLA